MNMQCIPQQSLGAFDSLFCRVQSLKRCIGHRLQEHAYTQTLIQLNELDEKSKELRKAIHEDMKGMK